LAGKIGPEHTRMKIKEMTPPPPRPQGRVLEGDVDAQVKTLVDLLRKEAQVI
jgi:hypothetical protein